MAVPGPRRLATAAACAAMTVAATLGLASTGPAARPASAAATAAVATAAIATAANETRVADDQGRTRMLGAIAGRRLASAPAGVRDPAAAARAQLAGLVGRFGLRTVDGLRPVSVRATPSGGDVVRLQQRVDGIPVLGAQLVAVLDRSADLLSVGGEVTTRVHSPAYDVSAARAHRHALLATARAHDIPVSALRSARPTRWLFDASLLDPGRRGGARAVWRAEVRAPARPDIRELVLVDAGSGAVRLQVDQVAHVLDRVVCDNANAAARDMTCGPGRYARTEGAGPTGLPDVDQAYDLTGLTADWFTTRLGVDLTQLIGTDRGDGRKLRSTTRACLDAEDCPMANAFWNGSQMVYGEGFAASDDVVAHELSHGVTQQTAGLIYWFQSGAINESMSDVFGELVDLASPVGNDAPDARWLLGEDLVGRIGRVARDMADPPAYGQPDYLRSPLYDLAANYDDNGGVHTNSGVPNKAAYLVVDGTVGEPGGAFNGRSFAGIGADKATVLYWSTLQMLTPGADFADLAATLGQACANLAGSGALVAADCQSVTSATEATGLTGGVGLSQPRDVGVTTGVGSLQLTWRPPASLGSAPLRSYAVHVRPPIGADDFFPLEPGAREVRLDGLEDGTRYTVGLVAVSADGTSPSVVRSVGAASLRVHVPESITYGSRLKVPGTLTATPGVPVRGRLVRLLRKAPGRAGFEQVGSDRSAADGSFVLTARAVRRGSYVVLYAGSGTRLGDRSARRVVLVEQDVRVRSDPSVRVGDRARFLGRVSPDRPGASVRLQRQARPAGPWRTVARTGLGPHSRYDLAVRVRAPGTDRWRIQVGARRGAGLAAGTSRTLRITARP